MEKNYQIVNTLNDLILLLLDSIELVAVQFVDPVLKFKWSFHDLQRIYKKQ